MTAAAMPHADRRLYALGLRLIAIFCLSSMGALIKLAEAEGAHFAEIIFWRQAAAIPIVLVWVMMAGSLATLRTARFRSHVSRTVFGLVGMVANFAAVIMLPLAEATTLSFTVPIFATIFAAVWLKEAVGWHRWGAVLAGFSGVLIVVGPGGGFPVDGLAVGLFAAFMVAFVSILLRELGRTESAPTTVFWFSALSVPVLIGPWLVHAQPHDAAGWALLVGIGLIGGIGQMALTAALRFAPVSTVVPMDYSSLVWSTLYGWLLFGVLPAASTWIGAPVIIVSGLYIVWREHVRSVARPAIPPVS